MCKPIVNDIFSPRFRDNAILVSYLRSTVRSGSKLPLAAQKETGVKLLALLKPYSNIAQLPNQQETELIDALLYDFAKPEYSAHITALGLDNVVTELKNVNTRYKELSVTRTESRANEALETGKTLRLEIDKVYDRLQSLAFAAFLTSPSTEASEFVASLNQLIEETKTLHKLRRSGYGCREMVHTLNFHFRAYLYFEYG
jgi:hypothetical protein